MLRSDENTIKRWKFMASKDLGIDRSREAGEFARFFEQVFTADYPQISGKTFHFILPILRGFAINNDGCYEACSVVECLDLSTINWDKEAARDLDWYLMNNCNWFCRYQYAQSV